MSNRSTEGFPRAFGPYLLLTSFGRGGMGEVFLAKRRVLKDVDRLCVVKTIRGDLAESREYVSRFLDEARLAVQLNHPNISQVYEVTQVGADHCMAMEYIPGCNLREVVGDAKLRCMPISEGCALYFTECVLDALAWAHAFRNPMTNEPLRIVHRDVSPANVMVGFEGDVKLIDFGLAESTLKQEETETRVVMGKVGYMSPEQARGDEVSGAADQFAAAVMLCELLLGARFYGDWNVHEIWQVVGHGGHRPAGFETLPQPVQVVLNRALEATPERRYASCAAFGEAVAELRATRAPRAGKALMRELMQQLYADRADATRDVIASLADARAPVEEDNHAGQSSNSSAAESGTRTSTDPWRTSASSPSPSRWDGNTLPKVPQSSPFDLTVGSDANAMAAGAAGTTPSTPTPTTEPTISMESAGVRPPTTRAVALLIGVIVSGVAGAIGFALRPESRTAEARAHDIQVTSAPPSTARQDPPAVQASGTPLTPSAAASPPASVTLSPTSPESITTTPARSLPSDGSPRLPTRPKPRGAGSTETDSADPARSAQPAQAGQQSTGVVEKAAASPPAERSIRELYDALGGCSQSCVTEIRSLWNEQRKKKGDGVFEHWLRAAEPSIRRCASDLCELR